MAVMLAMACGPNEGVLRSGKETPAPDVSAVQQTPIESEIDSMRTAGFVFIYVLRRKDGLPIDAEDRSVIKLRTVDTNRRVAAEEGRAVIIGSNYQIQPNNLTALYQRFSIENYTDPPVVETNSNVIQTK